MIKLFVSVDLYTDVESFRSHTFSFNYGEVRLENFIRAAQDWVYNSSEARYVELNIEGVAVPREEILRAWEEGTEEGWNILFTHYTLPSLENTV